MTKAEFWKNFSLGTELQISGSFIYNAIFSFDRMNFFYFEEQCFEFLYQASVGIERLQKIVIILTEHTDNINQSTFEKSLISHNHLELHNRIKAKHLLKLSDVHIHFLDMLSTFYKSSRYGKYGLSSVDNLESSKIMLIAFVEKHLKIKIHATLSNSTEIGDNIKKFIGKTIGKIVDQLYILVENTASSLNIYTYEVTYDSKAYKIFIAKDYTFLNEQLLRRELLIAFLQEKFDEGFVDFIKKIKPIEFESHSASEYIKYLVDLHSKYEFLEELETRYEDEPYNKERIASVSLIGTDISLQDEHDDSE